MKSTFFQRSKGISLQEMDGELFLANEESGSIFHLNAYGSAFWRALEEPQDLNTIIDLFSVGFPDQKPARLAEDIRTLANQLEEHELILRSET